MTAPRPKLGIIAGKGNLPRELIAACRDAKRDLFVLALEGITETDILTGTSHAWVRIGAVAAALGHLKDAGVEEIVMAGQVERPSLFSLRPDAAGMQLLARMGGALLAGDDSLLSTLAHFLEEQGFRIVGADEVLGTLLAAEGTLSRAQPNAQDLEDIRIGMRVVKTLGALDIGQAAIIQHGHVLGVEAMEGTEALIARCAALRLKDQPGGVLVKARKPQQERRVDLPAIGAATIAQLRRAGFCGVAVEAGNTLILERDAVIAEADALELFVVTVPPQP